MIIETTHITLLNKLGESNNSAAWDEFHARYGKLIRSFARRQGLQAADIDDVLQDVLIALTKAMTKFEYDPAKGKFRSFLKTIALRSIFKKFRQNNRLPGQGTLEETVSNAANDAEVDQHWESEWRQYHLRQAMRTLQSEFPDSHLAAFRLYAIGQRSAQETADALAISVDLVYQAKSRILKRLSEVIAAQTEDEG